MIPTAQHGIGLGARRRIAGSGNLHALWKRLMQLPEWFLLGEMGDPDREGMPIIRWIDGRSWILVFSDPVRAQSWARTHPQGLVRDDEGNVRLVRMKPTMALRYVRLSNDLGVHGVRIDEPDGWTFPIESIPAIDDWVRQAGGDLVPRGRS